MGYVYGNLMINVRTKNVKLAERAITILQRAAGIERKAAEEALAAANDSVPVALVMLETQATKTDAIKKLKSARGHVRNAIAAARRSK
jgi:N-acetylmuramic acid 6-phosphate etherase